MKRKILLSVLIGFVVVTGLLIGCATTPPMVDVTTVTYPLGAFAPVEREATEAMAESMVEINIFTTNDEHGWFFDWDFGTGKPRVYRGNPMPSGLARVSTKYKELAAVSPNPILLSAGDTIQGTILSYYYNFIDTEMENPMAKVFGTMGYSLWTIGNHEVEQKNDVLLKVANEMAAEGVAVLSANSVYEGTEDPFYLPYAVKEVEGVRIGFLGLTTPGIPMWLADDTHEGYEFLDMVATAEKYVDILRNVEKVDVLIGVFHAGMNEQYDLAKAEAAGVPISNASSLVAKAIGSGPMGFDAIVTGHSHKTINDEINTEYRDSDSNEVNGVIFIQAQNWGSALGHLTVKVGSADGKWIVDDVKAQTHSMEGVDEDPAILDIMAPYIAGGKEYAATAVAQASADITAERSFVEDTAVVDLIHETQFWATGADISIAASFGSSTLIKEGDITVGKIAAIYIYENSLKAVELTGQQVKDYLEYSARYYNTISEENIDEISLINPDIRGYNYDMVDGLLYEIDITAEPGSRIINLMNEDGSPFDLSASYVVALNSYRYNGGGGHMGAIGAVENGILTVNTVYASDLAMRDLMIEFLKVTGEWGPDEKDDNWRLVPEELAEEAINLQLGVGTSAR